MGYINFGFPEAYITLKFYFPLPLNIQLDLCRLQTFGFPVKVCRLPVPVFLFGEEPFSQSGTLPFPNCQPVNDVVYPAGAYK